MAKKSKLSPSNYFDFKVSLPIHAATTIPGGSIITPVMIETLKGEPRLIELTATDWSAGGLTAELMPSRTLSSTAATLSVMVTPEAPPGNYLFTVQGTT